jgi:hypothetical protein
LWHAVQHFHFLKHDLHACFFDAVLSGVAVRL